jgi:RimJ/RimL family protein N-acetyltransferase
VLTPESFRDQPVLHGEQVRLEPLTLAVLAGYLTSLADPELQRLTGTHAVFEPQAVEAWLGSRQDQHDRADWAIVRAEDGAFLGEAVLNDFDADNQSANYRVFLAAPQFFGRGYGTEVTRLVLNYAFDTVGLHRVALGVFDFNPRAQRVYAKCGFVVEGVQRDALRWNGAWHDQIIMSIVSSDPR